MKNRFVLKCEDFEDHELAVYVKSIDFEDNSFGFYVTEDINEAKRFTEKEAYKWSNEIYDSYCDEFEVIKIGE